MMSSDEESNEGLQNAYSVTDLLGELESDSEPSEQPPGGKEGQQGDQEINREHADYGVNVANGKSQNEYKKEQNHTDSEMPQKVASNIGPGTVNGKSEGSDDNKDHNMNKSEKFASSEHAESVRQSRSRSKSPLDDRASTLKIQSDISGRMYFEGPQYVDSAELSSAVEEDGVTDEIREEASEGGKRSSQEEEEEEFYDTTEKIYENQGAPALTREQKATNSQRIPKYIQVLPSLPPKKLGLNISLAAANACLEKGEDNEECDQEPESACYDNETYEPIWPASPMSATSPSREDEDDCSWGSSEFESYDDDDDATEDGAANQPPNGTTPLDMDATHEIYSKAEIKVKTPEPTKDKVLDKLAAKLAPKSKKEENRTEDLMCVEVTLNLDKHPPAELPPQPENLSPHQIKRRYIIASIVESEKSYTSSLKRILEDYERPLLEGKSHIISKGAVKLIFNKVRDILQCHNMFHIELAEFVKVWDSQEKLGDVFTASFSKAIVFDVYSAFVNNFSVAMETAKKQARQKPAFAEFLKEKIKAASDKLSLFALMVKPVQRFPQFILQLQDMLKYTPHEHHDRLALQRALTELENLTHKLNETKRESENRLDVKKIMHSLTGRYSMKQEAPKQLVRQDDVIQMDQHGTESKTKPRKLFMFSQQLICATVIGKETDSGYVEKYKYKWSVPIREVEILDNDITSLYQVKSRPGRTTIVSRKSAEPPVDNPWRKELDNMLHDLPIIEQLTQLVSQLRLNYEGLSPDYLHGFTRRLQLAIQQHSDVDLSILQISVPTKYIQSSADKLKEEMSKVKHKSKHKVSRGVSRVAYTFHMQSSTLKQDWTIDLKNAKLALDPSNNPGWHIPESEQLFTFKLPLFIKPLLIDITKQETKEEPIYENLDEFTRIQCAIPVILPKSDNPCIGTQHLWVCSGEANRGQVTIVSLQGVQPHVVESFKACDTGIMCAEMVPGFAAIVDEYVFCEDTVWMALESKTIIIQNVVEEDRGDISVSDFVVPDVLEAVPVCMKYLDGRMYVGLDNGTLLIYVRDNDGLWEFKSLKVLLGDKPVHCLLPVNHSIWASCGGNVHTITMTTRYVSKGPAQNIKKNCHQVAGEEEGEIQCMVTAGVGLLVSLRGKAVIKIFCAETFQHLQDVNVASMVTRVLESKEMMREVPGQLQHISITYMLASKGLLWAGTNIGCILTLPLPRLEGVPQIKGRPCVSFHAHIGPIKFVAPIHCGVTQLQRSAVRQAPSMMSERRSDEDSNSIGQCSLEDQGSLDNNSAILNIMGVTETETEDSHRGFTQSDVYDTLRSRSSGEFDPDMLTAQEMGSLKRSKWTSTPDLRDSQDDISNLYGSLLRGTEYEEYDFDLMDIKRKRPQSDRGIYNLSRESSFSRASRFGRRGSKYNTLPIVMEDCPVYETMDCRRMSQNSEAQSVEQDQPAEGDEKRSNISPRSSCHAPVSPQMSQSSLFKPMEAPSSGSSSNFNSKSMIIVSGGEGHVNWSEAMAGDTRYEDICLLLWQCKL